MTDRWTEHPVMVEEAMSRLNVIPDYDDGNGPRPCVHTLIQSTVGLLGAHWGVEAARTVFETFGVEEAGEQARAMGHGLVVTRPSKGPIFFETLPDERTFT